MGVHMDGWKNGWIKRQMILVGWMGGQMVEWINESTNDWMN